MADPKIKELRDELARTEGKLVARARHDQGHIRAQRDMIEHQTKIIDNLERLVSVQDKLVSSYQDIVALQGCMVTELDDEISELKAELEKARG